MRRECGVSVLVNYCLKVTERGVGIEGEWSEKITIITEDCRPEREVHSLLGYFRYVTYKTVISYQYDKISWRCNWRAGIGNFDHIFGDNAPEK